MRLKRFFGEGVKGDYLFLIDEAHNLVERGREMFSAALCKEDFLELKRALKAYKGTILLVSHDPDFYGDIVDEVWNLEEWTTKIL